MSEHPPHSATPSSTDEFETVQGKPILPTRLIWAVALISLALMAYPSLNFLRETVTLQDDLSQTDANAVIGYLGLHPNLSYARPPGHWLQREGSKIKLWSGWVHGVGHTWFVVDPSEIQTERLGDPIGRDAFPPIDYPIIETSGGQIWQRVPDQADVVGERLAMVDTAYPILVLDKVVLVNDVIEDQPFLVTYNRFEAREKRVVIFDPVVEGKRLTFGHTGYLQNKIPIFYDRGTESLWTIQGDVLASISGHYKGRFLKKVARPAMVPWGDWRYDHPESRLVVGSDRKKTRPQL